MAEENPQPTTTKEINWKVPFSTRVKEDCREFFKGLIEKHGSPVAAIDHCIRYTMNGGVVSGSSNEVLQMQSQLERYKKDSEQLQVKLKAAEDKLAAKPAPVAGIQLTEEANFWASQIQAKKKLASLRDAVLHAIKYTFKNDWI